MSALGREVEDEFLLTSSHPLVFGGLYNNLSYKYLLLVVLYPAFLPVPYHRPF